MARFNSVTAALAGKAGHEGKGKRPRSQIIALQNAACHHALDKKTPVGVVASLMRAYVDLAELRMSVEGIGKPKPVDAKNSQPAKRQRLAPRILDQPAQPGPPDKASAA